MKMQYQKYQKMQFYIQLYIDIWEIILYLQANPYRLSKLSKCPCEMRPGGFPVYNFKWQMTNLNNAQTFRGKKNFLKIWLAKTQLVICFFTVKAVTYFCQNFHKCLDKFSCLPKYLHSNQPHVISKTFFRGGKDSRGPQ